MIYQALIIALIVLSIHYTMLEGEIFAGLGRWFEKHLPPAIHPAVFECNVCMSFWYGHVIYAILWGLSWYSFVVVICAMGFNIIINKWAPKDEINVTNHY
jgi:hypothetical protein